jgi:CHAD domain-containing protein
MEQSSMTQYARQQTAQLLERLSAALTSAATEAGADSIHDVRVALRRLSRCLRVFEPFYPEGSSKKMRRRIRALLTAAGAVRDCDIAIELAGHAGLASRNPLVVQLTRRRRVAGRDLLAEVRRWKHRDYPRKWSSKLELEP